MPTTGREVTAGSACVSLDSGYSSQAEPRAWGSAAVSLGWSSSPISASYALFFPLFFLSDVVAPKQALAGWYQGVAAYNPVTNLMEALRSLILVGWQPWILGKGLIALEP